MTWGRILAGVLKLLNALADYFKTSRDIELGQLREREANAQANRDIADAIRNADPDSVSDSEAFGPDNDLSGAGKK